MDRSKVPKLVSKRDDNSGGDHDEQREERNNRSKQSKIPVIEAEPNTKPMIKCNKSDKSKTSTDHINNTTTIAAAQASSSSSICTSSHANHHHNHSAVNYQTLIKRTRYTQIEAELEKLQRRLTEIESQQQHLQHLQQQQQKSKSNIKCLRSIGTETIESIDQRRFGDDVAEDEDEDQAENDKSKSNFFHFRNRNKQSLSALHNIEDDLHRILFILLRQYELCYSGHPHRKRRLNHSHTHDNDKHKHNDNDNDNHISLDLGHDDDNDRISPKPAIVFRNRKSISFPDLSLSPHDEYSHQRKAFFLHHPIRQSAIKFRSRSNDTKSRKTEDAAGEAMRQRPPPPPSTSKSSLSEISMINDADDDDDLQHHRHKPHTNYAHFHLTKPDIHWIMGTSANPSHSLVARQQSALASLKRHGPLCVARTSSCLLCCCSNAYWARAWSSGPGPGPGGQISGVSSHDRRASIINRTQAIITALQRTYDRLYRELQFRQIFDSSADSDCGHSNPGIHNYGDNDNDNEERKHRKKSSSSDTISELSDHLLRIADHLHELHLIVNSLFLH